MLPLPKTLIQGLNENIRPDNGPWMAKRTYRDSAYAIMASMYVQLQPNAFQQLKTNQVEHGMRNFTDLEVAYDHRSGKFGAFKGMEKLVNDQLVRKEKGRGTFSTILVRSVHTYCRNRWYLQQVFDVY